MNELKNKEYGLKITDALDATYTQWFNTDGVFKSVRGLSSELLQLGRELGEMSLKQAILHAEDKCSKSGMCVARLYYNDFKRGCK